MPKYVCINSKISTNLPMHVYYMLWKFQVIWRSRKKVFLLATFMTPKFRHLRKIAWFWLPPTQRSLQQFIIFFISELLQYIGNMFKKSLNVNDAWFGFYSHFEKGTLHVHMNNFKIPCQKYSTNMATGSYVTSRENHLDVTLWLFIPPPPPSLLLNKGT